MQRFLVFLILFALLCLVVYDSVVAVPEGYTGVATIRVRRLAPLLGSPQNLDPGLSLSLPFVTTLQLYSTRVHMLYVDVPIPDRKIFRLTAQVRLNSDSAVLLHQRIGPNYLNDVMKPTLRAVMEKEIYAGHGNMSMAENQQQLLDAVAHVLALDGLTLDRAILTRLEHLELKDEQSTSESGEESDTDEEAD